MIKVARVISYRETMGTITLPQKQPVSRSQKFRIPHTSLLFDGAGVVTTRLLRRQQFL